MVGNAIGNALERGVSHLNRRGEGHAVGKIRCRYRQRRGIHWSGCCSRGGLLRDVVSRVECGHRFGRGEELSWVELGQQWGRKVGGAIHGDHSR